MSTVGGGAPGGGGPGVQAAQTSIIMQTLNRLVTTIAAVFPQATGTSTTATAGTATLPPNPVGFVDVFVPSLGATVKVPYYDT